MEKLKQAVKRAAFTARARGKTLLAKAVVTRFSANFFFICGPELRRLRQRRRVEVQGSSQTGQGEVPAISSSIDRPTP
jgi:hypothetical protein